LDSQASIDADIGNRTPIVMDAASGIAPQLLYRDTEAEADMLDAPTTPLASMPSRSLSTVHASTHETPIQQYPPLPTDAAKAEQTRIRTQAHVHASKQSQSPILLIIAALPRLLAPLMREDHVRGHALLAHLGRRLGHLTHRAPVCAILLNTTVGVPRASDAATAYGSANANVNANASLGTLESAFGDVSERPALGRTWPFLVDVGVMLSRHGHMNSKRQEAGRGGGEWIVEVLADRHGQRVGRWGVLEVEA